MKSTRILEQGGLLAKSEDCGVFGWENSAARRGIRVDALLILDSTCLMRSMR